RKELAKRDVTEAINKHTSIGNVRQRKRRYHRESGRFSQLYSDSKASIESYSKAIVSLPENQQESLGHAKKVRGHGK
ncbi:hypothetical protein NAI32_12605, partial [Francisella tularensis subsp. holarctica]|nr:hypothetical protein [Francisella tularensis subsp. holarctica]